MAVIVASAENLGNDCEFWRSLDNGETWTEYTTAADAWRANTFLVTRAGDILAGTSWTTGQIWRSQNNGVDWAHVQTLAGAEQVHALVMAPNGDLLAGTQSPGQIWRSQNDGLTWALVQALGGENRVYCLVVAPNGDIIAGTGSDAEFWRSQDDGATWAEMAKATGESYVYSLVVAANGDIIAGTANGAELWRSQDNGATWAQVDTAAGNRVNSLVRATNNDLILITHNVTTQFWRSQDNGANWAWVQTATADTVLNRLLVAENGDILASGEEHAWGPGVIWRSQDNGATWAHLTDIVGTLGVHALGPGAGIMGKSLETLRAHLAEDMGKFFTGVADDSAVGTLIDTDALALFTEANALVGSMLYIRHTTDGLAPEHQWRWIETFDQVNQVIAVVYNFTAAPMANDVYEIYRAPLTLEQWTKAVNEAIRDAWPDVWERGRQEIVSTGADEYALGNNVEDVLEVNIVMIGDYVGSPVTRYPPAYWRLSGLVGSTLQLELLRPVDAASRTIQVIYKGRYQELAVDEVSELDFGYIMAAAQANVYQMLQGEASGQADAGSYLQLLNYWRDEGKRRKEALHAALMREPLPRGGKR